MPFFLELNPSRELIVHTETQIQMTSSLPNPASFSATAFPPHTEVEIAGYKVVNNLVYESPDNIPNFLFFVHANDTTA